MPRRLLIRSSGFTLVELLVVLVILAVLAAVAFMSFAGAQTAAHDSVAQQNLAVALQTAQTLDSDHLTSPASASTELHAVQPTVTFHPSATGNAAGPDDVSVSVTDTTVSLCVRSNSGTFFCGDQDAGSPTQVAFTTRLPDRASGPTQGAALEVMAGTSSSTGAGVAGWHSLSD